MASDVHVAPELHVHMDTLLKSRELHSSCKDGSRRA